MFMFLSSLTYCSGYAEDGTYKIALFCEKLHARKQVPRTKIENYPKELIIDSDSIKIQGNEIQKKILMSHLKISIFDGWLQKITTSMEHQQKSTPISGTGMKMVKKCEFKNFDTSELDNKIIEIFEILRNGFDFHLVHDETTENKTSIECKTKIAFLETKYICPQLPHVVYPWLYLDSTK